FVVFHYKNRFSSRMRYPCGVLKAGRVRLADRTGQVDPEGCPFAQLTLDCDFAAALLHNSVCSRESEPGALALLFCGEERLKNLRSGSCVHPETSVAHGQHHVVARRQREIGSLLTGWHVDVYCLDRESTAVGHRISRVHRQIYDHLLDLAGVCLYATNRPPD